MMMKKLRVWGGLIMIGHAQRRVIVGTFTKMRAVELLRPYGISMNYFNDYWAETGNETELHYARLKPETLLVAYNEVKYKELNP